MKNKNYEKKCKKKNNKHKIYFPNSPKTESSLSSCARAAVTNKARICRAAHTHGFLDRPRSRPPFHSTEPPSIFIFFFFSFFFTSGGRGDERIQRRKGKWGLEGRERERKRKNGRMKEKKMQNRKVEEVDKQRKRERVAERKGG